MDCNHSSRKNHPALPLRKFWPDHEIGDAGLVLDSEENRRTSTRPAALPESSRGRSGRNSIRRGTLNSAGARRDHHVLRGSSVPARARPCPQCPRGQAIPRCWRASRSQPRWCRKLVQDWAPPFDHATFHRRRAWRGAMNHELQRRKVILGADGFRQIQKTDHQDRNQIQVRETVRLDQSQL